jgi:hypothetical protein
MCGDKQEKCVSEYLDCDEFKFLRAKFSSGVCLRELRSIAVVLSQLTGLLEPNRDIKRSYVLLIKWFKNHWNQILPWLPLIQLRDGEDRPIDGRREISERGLGIFPLQLNI